MRKAVVCLGAVILVLAGAAGCGQSTPSPSSPSPLTTLAPPADFAGVWQGQYKVTSCSGERHCYDWRIGSTLPFVLRLSQSKAVVTGIMEVMSSVVDVSGEVTKDGELTLSGSRSATRGMEGLLGFTVSLTGLRLDGAQGLSGAVSYKITPPVGEEWPYTEITHGGSIQNAARGALPTISPAALAAYEGTWKGTYLVTSCEVQGSRYCYPELPDGGYEMTLDLRINGEGLEGELSLFGTRIPVNAAVSPSGIEVRGTESHVVSGGTSSTTILAWKASRDAYDRLGGTLEYERRYTPISSEPAVSHYYARLAGVTRRP